MIIQSVVPIRQIIGSHPVPENSCPNLQVSILSLHILNQNDKPAYWFYVLYQKKYTTHYQRINNINFNDRRFWPNQEP